jgi:hypothetical protein
MEKEQPIRITETSIGGTVYVVESMESDRAKENALTKIKRLITTNAKGLIKAPNSISK